MVLAPGEGRRYDLGRVQAVFKADGTETAGGYSISEWWLEPNTAGPGPHSHPEDDTFYVLEGTMSVRRRRPVDRRAAGLVRPRAGAGSSTTSRTAA